MTPAQTSYAINQEVAYEGGLYALAPHDIVSRDVEGASGIGFGKAVSRGTDKDRQAVLGGTDFIGISVRSLDREGVINTGAIKYNETEAMAVLRDGYIWVVCPDGCVPGNAVNFVNATGVFGAGAAVAGETLLDGAFWDTTAAAGELAIIRLNSLDTTAGA